MNKTININLGGVFFHIDEIAYKKLKKYLDLIRKSLSDDPKGKDEILTDIESRIGEILAENVKDVRQVVNEQDIDSIIEVMGKPEDYVGDEEYFEENSSRTYTNSNSKKLYRDTNDKFLGGVSSGLAHYFGFDVIWIRLIWLFLVFGGGIGLFVYIILWILLPEAHTTAEKLEMEGEPVNITNIEKKIREEFTNASNIVKDGIDDVSNHLKKKKYQGKVKTGSQEIVSLFGRIFSTLFGIVGKFIGVILLFVGAIIIITSIIGIFTAGSFELLGFSNTEIFKYPPFFYNATIPIWLLTIFFFLALMIPFVVLFMLGLKILSSNSRSLGRTAKLSLLGVWLISIFGLTFSGIEFGTKFANEKTMIQTHDLSVNNQNTLVVKMQSRDYEELDKMFGVKTIQDNDIEKIYGTSIRLYIKESATSNTFLKVYKKANGSTRSNAEDFANQIEYQYNLTESDLLLNAYFLTNLKNKFQNQSVKIVLHLAEGTKIYFDKSIRNYLRYVDNVQDLRTREMINHNFKMTPKGLDCLDCETNKKEEKVIEIITKEIEKKKDSVKEVLKLNDTKPTPVPMPKKINKHVNESENGLEIN